ncbi:MAG: hypothetical protein IJS20_10810 [Bacteroidales bacterium]|nr:hypothetical protein [Bacteroidales bacterium]
MKNKTCILTSGEYFDFIEFQRLTDLEQVGYILFYVTEIAHLRSDMTAAIISDRIRDQYISFSQRNEGVKNSPYVLLEEKQVESILESNTDWFQKVNSGLRLGSDRGPNQKKTPYRLVQSKKDELWNRFDRDIRSTMDFQKKRIILDRSLTILLFIACSFLFFVFAFNKFYAEQGGLIVTSVRDYANIIQLKDYNHTKKGVLFVYYVTELTKMRTEVNATAIRERVMELNCEMPSQEELNILLDNTEMLTSSSQNPKAYSLTDLGINYAEDVVNSHVKKDDGIKLSMEVLIAIIGGIFSLLGFVMVASYNVGKRF